MAKMQAAGCDAELHMDPGCGQAFTTCLTQAGRAKSNGRRLPRATDSAGGV